MADVGTLAFLGQTFWRNPSDSDLIPHSEQVKVKKLKSESEQVKKWKSESEQVKKWKWMADVGALAFLGQKTFWRNPKRWPDSTHWASELHLNWVGGAFVSFVDKLRLICGLVDNKWLIVDFFTLCICVFVDYCTCVFVYFYWDWDGSWCTTSGRQSHIHASISHPVSSPDVRCKLEISCERKWSQPSIIFCNYFLCSVCLLLDESE